jgi:glycosyltransferase involved in cell wall biosynthesis
VRILVFHGYLLAGTGSNVYNARLAAALVKLGHEVHLLSQDRHAERQPYVDALGDWDEGELRLRGVRSPRAGAAARCTVYRPNIGRLLPVYVADRYEGIEARTFAECSEAELAHYLEANVAAVRELVARVSPDLALANHLVMGPAILARALGGEVPYAVKVHGSALEYTVKPEPRRFLPFAREGVGAANGILVGSHHTAASLWQALGDADVERRTRLGPPGVDVERFVPRSRDRAIAGVRELTARLSEAERARGERSPAVPAVGGEGAAGGEAAPADAFARDERAVAQALGELQPERDRLVAFVGKLIVSKGVDLLLAAWPLVLEDAPDATLVVVGFGAYREGFERLRDALAAGDLAAARELALAGRTLEGDTADRRPLRHLLAFLERLDGDRQARYVQAARALGERVVLTGRLEHDELAELLPACEAIVVPSTFPEAFGMVAAEAAACGALPISALAAALPSELAALLSFPVDDDAVGAIAARVTGWLAADAAARESARAGLVETVSERWSWEGVARGVIAAARGELDGLQTP